MPGLVPGIHVFALGAETTWMAGTGPAMTWYLCLFRNVRFRNARDLVDVDIQGAKVDDEVCPKR